VFSLQGPNPLLRVMKCSRPTRKPLACYAFHFQPLDTLVYFLAERATLARSGLRAPVQLSVTFLDDCFRDANGYIRTLEAAGWLSNLQNAGVIPEQGTDGVVGERPQLGNFF
jgi:hypothetical protein